MCTIYTFFIPISVIKRIQLTIWQDTTLYRNLLIYPGNRYIIEKVKVCYKLHLNKCSTSQSSIFSKQQILDENKLSDLEDLTSVTSFSLFVSFVRVFYEYE